MWAAPMPPAFEFAKSHVPYIGLAKLLAFDKAPGCTTERVGSRETRMSVPLILAQCLELLRKGELALALNLQANMKKV